MHSESLLSNLRHFARQSVQDGHLFRKGGVALMEIIDHYEQAFYKKPVPKPKASNGNTRNAPKKRASVGSG